MTKGSWYPMSIASKGFPRREEFKPIQAALHLEDKCSVQLLHLQRKHRSGLMVLTNIQQRAIPPQHALQGHTCTHTWQTAAQAPAAEWQCDLTPSPSSAAHPLPPLHLLLQKVPRAPASTQLHAITKQKLLRQKTGFSLSVADHKLLVLFCLPLYIKQPTATAP